MLSDYDSLVRRLLAEDLGSYAQKISFCLEFLDYDRSTVRDLLIERAQYFFAYDLRGYLALRLVGYHVLRKEELRFFKIF